MEDSLVQHLIHLSNWGFPFDTMDLRMTVKRILDKEGRTVKCFKANVPGEDWCSGFMDRHKAMIKNRMCQNITRKRAEVNRETIEQYFTELAQSIDGVPPENIINYDETNLTDDPGRKRLIFKRGIRYPERVMNSTKTSTSLMLAGTAAGEILPVYMLCTNRNISGVHGLKAAHTKPDLTGQSQAGSTMSVLLTGSGQLLFPTAGVLRARKSSWGIICLLISVMKY